MNREKNTERSPRLSVPLNVFSGFYDRYVTEGYSDPTGVEDQLAAVLSFPELTGVELVGRGNVDDRSLPELRRRLRDTRLQVSLVIADLWASRRWASGSLAASNPATRQAAIDEVQRSMFWAAELGCDTVNLWLGQDGYDYPLSADFPRAWDQLVQGVTACAAANPGVRLAIEYKLKEPRTHCYVSTVGKALLLVRECGRDNIGGLVDTGHALMAYENPAESAALLDRCGSKLFYVHLNDNWRSWDDDMLVGSVHVPEFVEFFYWLDRLAYRGWIGFDMYPYRENTRQIVRAGIDWTLALVRTARQMDPQTLARALAEGDAMAANALLREAMFPQR